MPRWIREKFVPGFLEAVGLNPSPELVSVLVPKPKEKIIFGGWRAGKSTAGFCEIAIDIAINDGLNPRLYWIIVPSYADPCEEMMYLYSYYKKMGMVRRWVKPEKNSWLLEVSHFAWKESVVIET